MFPREASRSPGLRWLLPASLVPLLIAGCFSSAADQTCTGSSEYLEARNLPPLQMPEGLQAPDHADALKVPEGPRGTTTGTEDGRCLDLPPDYFTRRPGSSGQVPPNANPVEGAPPPAPAGKAPPGPPPDKGDPPN